jgi:serine/threonine protein kinase
MGILDLYDNGAWRAVSTLYRKPGTEVYKVVNKFNGSKAALKVVSFKHSSEDAKDSYKTKVMNAMLEGVRLEFQILDELKNEPHIVQCQDRVILKRADNQGCYAVFRMELLQCMRNAQLDIDETAKLGIDICKALEILSSKKIMHRDIKPGNIYLDSKGAYKLGDFSVAKKYGETISDSLIAGTYGYMAPEIIERKEYNHTIDLFSLGRTLIELSKNSFVNMSNELKYILGKACSEKSEERYQSSSEMLRRLKVATWHIEKEERSQSEIFKSMLMKGDMMKYESPISGMYGTTEKERRYPHLAPKLFNPFTLDNEGAKGGTEAEYRIYPQAPKMADEAQTAASKASSEPFSLDKTPIEREEQNLKAKIKKRKPKECYDYTSVAEWAFYTETYNEVNVKRIKKNIINNREVENLFVDDDNEFMDFDE